MVVSSSSKVILNKADRFHNIQAVRDVLERCRNQMESPRQMHFITGINIKCLPSKIIQKIKELYVSEFNKFEEERKLRLGQKSRKSKIRNRKVADIEIIYSIESKVLSDSGCQHDHIHFMFIVDFGHNRFNYREMMSIINRTLNRLPFVQKLESSNDFNYEGHYGKNECGFFRYRDIRSTIQAEDADKDLNGQFKDKFGHNLKTEFNDAVIRASYLCKSEQKNLLPDEIKRYSFGHTRAKRSVNDELYRQIA